MTDEEKLKWFDSTMEWVGQWGDKENALAAVDYSSDAPYDLFFDTLDQWEKCGSVSTEE